MFFSLKNTKTTFQNTALVTGGSKGIGRGIALGLAESKFNLAINHSRSASKAKEVIREIENLGQKGLVIKADISQREQVKLLVEGLLKEFGRIDVLINNAGVVFEPADWQKISEMNFRKTLEVNLTGTFNCIREIAPIMLKQKSGKIVNVASFAGILPGKARAPAYAAAKAGVINLTKAFAKELAPYVNVNAVAPTWVRTDWHSHKGKEFFKKVESLTPMGRIAEIEDVVNTVLFLVSDKASFITGQTLIIDGGLSL